MHDAVPGVAGAHDEDVDLAVAEGGGFGDQGLDVGRVEDVAAEGDGLAAGFADGFCDLIGFYCRL